MSPIWNRLFLIVFMDGLFIMGKPGIIAIPLDLTMAHNLHREISSELLWTWSKGH